MDGNALYDKYVCVTREVLQYLTCPSRCHLPDDDSEDDEDEGRVAMVETIHHVII